MMTGSSRRGVVPVGRQSGQSEANCLHVPSFLPRDLSRVHRCDKRGTARRGARLSQRVGACECKVDHSFLAFKFRVSRFTPRQGLPALGAPASGRSPGRGVVSLQKPARRSPAPRQNHRRPS